MVNNACVHPEWSISTNGIFLDPFHVVRANTVGRTVVLAYGIDEWRIAMSTSLIGLVCSGCVLAVLGRLSCGPGKLCRGSWKDAVAC